MQIFHICRKGSISNQYILWKKSHPVYAWIDIIYRTLSAFSYTQNDTSFCTFIFDGIFDKTFMKYICCFNNQVGKKIFFALSEKFDSCIRRLVRTTVKLCLYVCSSYFPKKELDFPAVRQDSPASGIVEAGCGFKRYNYWLCLVRVEKVPGQRRLLYNKLVAAP